MVVERMYCTGVRMECEGYWGVWYVQVEGLWGVCAGVIDERNELRMMTRKTEKWNN